MTAMAPAAMQVTPGNAPGPTFGRLVRGELYKVRTTNLWWILGLCALLTLALALLVNCATAHFEIASALQMPDFAASYPPDQQPSAAEIAAMEARWRADNVLSTVLVRVAANVFTSGQYFGLLLVMLLGAIMVTSEYYHQTATTTFLTAPRRSQVILAKAAAAIVVAGIAWLVTTLINIGVGVTFFSIDGYANSLDVWSVQRSILMNLPAYALWALLGMGLGALLRNQIGATLVGAGLYLIGGQVVQLVFIVLHEFVLERDWVLQAMVAVPSYASTVMISSVRLPIGPFGDGDPIYAPPWWVGALVLVGYGVAATGLGILLTRRRDVS